jgi:hypothetical protein
MTIRITEISLPSVTEGTIRRDYVVFDNEIRSARRHILLANSFNRKIASRMHYADTTFGIRVKDFRHSV